jgi:hypothetical protein
LPQYETLHVVAAADLSANVDPQRGETVPASCPGNLLMAVEEECLAVDLGGGGILSDDRDRREIPTAGTTGARVDQVVDEFVAGSPLTKFDRRRCYRSITQ